MTFRYSFAVALGLTLICWAGLFSPSFADGYAPVLASSTVSLPGDFFSRPAYRVQWWYFTGHLRAAEGNEFGYQVTFFVVGVDPKPSASRFGLNHLYVSHFAVSDLSSGRFHFEDRIDRGAFGFAGASQDRLEAWVGRNRMEGTPDRIHLVGRDDSKALDLALVPERPCILQGDRGYSRKAEDSPSHASLYFSCTRLNTGGTLTLGGRSFQVRGRSWFDREITSSLLSVTQRGWDWFALHLEDGRDVMLYRMRKKDGTLDRYSSAVVVKPVGSVVRLGKDDFKAEPVSTWKSKKTSIVYPSTWSIGVPSESLRLTVTPLLKDQEAVATASTGNVYWEGAAAVTGTVRGRAYVELTGYR
jgi:predicted secreted hydrolase